MPKFVIFYVNASLIKKQIKMKRCNILVPDYDPHFDRKDGYDGCIQSTVNHDKHLNRLRDGTFIEWEDVTPHNNEGQPIESLAEFNWSEITKEEAFKILRASYEGNIPEVIMEIIDRE